MRICLLSNDYKSERRDSLGFCLRDHAVQLKRSGFEVEVITVDHTGNRFAIEDGVRIHKVALGRSSFSLDVTAEAMPACHQTVLANVALWTKFIELNQKTPFDVVEAPHEVAQGIVPAASRALPMVVRLSSDYSLKLPIDRTLTRQSFDTRLIGMLERLAIVLADVVIAPTDELADLAAGDLNYPRENIKVVGCDLKTSVANSIACYELAQVKFRAQVKPTLYLHGQERIMADTQAMLLSYDRMLYNLLYQQSWRFRIRHWARKFKRRPRLLAAKLAVRFGKAVMRVPGLGRTRLRSRLHALEWRLKQFESGSRDSH